MDADKGGPQPVETIQERRTVRFYPITEQELRSVDQQQWLASAALSFGTFFFGMLTNMLMAGAELDWRMAAVLVVVSTGAWALGARLWWTRRSLLSTSRA